VAQRAEQVGRVLAVSREPCHKSMSYFCPWLGYVTLGISSFVYGWTVSSYLNKRRNIEQAKQLLCR